MLSVAAIAQAIDHYSPRLGSMGIDCEIIYRLDGCGCEAKKRRKKKRVARISLDSEFEKVNKPKRTPGHPTKSHAVLASEGGKQKLIRFGQQGVKGSPKKKGEGEAYAKRRKAFKARHSKNIAKGKMSAAYWANKEKW